MSMQWQSYIGIPYEPGACHFGGCDCWGLVRLVMRTELGIDPGAYAADPKDVALVSNTIAGELAGGRWQSVPQGHEQAFDVAVINRVANADGRLIWGPFHVGIVTDLGHVLHCDESTSAIRLCVRDHGLNRRHPSWGGQRFEFWRLRQGQALAVAA